MVLLALTNVLRAIVTSFFLMSMRFVLADYLGFIRLACTIEPIHLLYSCNTIKA